jgi:hypothetical protein
VAGGDGLDPESAGLSDQALELHLGVAARAGQRRPALHVVPDERRDDAVVERALEVHDVVRDPETRGHRLGVVQVVERAAAPERRTLARGLVVELHRHADDLVARLLEEGRRHRGIDAAGHGGHDAHGAA